MANRKPREAETRATTAAQALDPAFKLEAPEAPAGYQHRWVETAIREDDKTNVPRSSVRGEPHADEYPTLEIAIQ